MSRPKSGTTRGRATQRAEVLALEGDANISQAAEKIRDGRAFLEIVSTPWGVEFYLHEGVGRLD